MTFFLFLKKQTILFLGLSLLIAVSNRVQAQTNVHFVLKGIILHEKKPQQNAEVKVYEGEQMKYVVKTNKRGKYLLRLPLQKNYIVRYTKGTLAPKTIKLSTVFPDSVDREKLRKNLLISLNKTDKERGAIAVYRYNPNGGSLLDYELEYSQQTETALRKVDRSRKQRTAVASATQKQIENLPNQQQQTANNKLMQVLASADSILALAKLEAEQIVLAAKEKGTDMLGNVHEQKQTFKQMNAFVDGNLPTKKEMDKFYVDKVKFAQRKDIKARELETGELKALRERTKGDSLRLMENAIFIRGELVKTAKYQLEIDRLHARTAQDSIVLLQKEDAIKQAEQEIYFAKTRLELQRAEIRNKNIVLMSVGIGILLLLGLLVLYIHKNIERAKLNRKLEKSSREINRQNTNIMASINYAKNIQNTILPSEINSQLLSDYFVLFKPKDIVSGDFFWYHQTENKLYIAAIDCTGHGVPGAFMSLIGNRLLNGILRDSNAIQPAEILTQLNRELVEALNQKVNGNHDGMDLALCLIENSDDSKLRSVTFAGAKRPLLLINESTRQLEIIKGDRMSIGGNVDREEKKFTQKKMELPKDSILYLSSDGFVDQNNEKRKRFGSKRLHELLSNSTSLNMKEQRQLLENELLDHQGESDQRDDITLVGIQL